MAGEKKISFRGTVQKAAVPCGFRECRVEICQRTALEFLRFRWSELAVAVTCVDLLTDRGIFMGGNEGKEGRIERENFFGRENRECRYLRRGCYRENREYRYLGRKRQFCGRGTE